MSQDHPVPPLDILQSMINAILIETGKALRATDKEGGRTKANANTRLRTTIPSTIDNFHQALDDIESDIVRAKAVLGRDLEELRAKRIALENPPVQIIEDPVKAEPATATISSQNHNSLLTPIVKHERREQIPPAKADIVAQDPPKEIIKQVSNEAKPSETLTPPSTTRGKNGKSAPVGLGINTTDTSNDPAAPTTAGAPDSGIDSLFDTTESANNDNDESGVNFDDMDFSLPVSNTNAQNQDLSQAQSNEFDLSTFGNNPQDFNMPDLQSSNDTNSGTNAKKQADSTEELFGMGNNTTGGDGINLDLNNMGMVGAEESLFDDIFFEGDNDAGTGGGGIGEMEHGQFDNAYFGLED
ncbi:hypothetical protein B7494_g1038 [Chlorociboria aeruginascens]|nr:hypothetical protein B7494_g1038 [Chlorociboria aeruginascens]